MTKSIRAWLGIGALAFSYALIGCSHEIESPKVTLDTIEPSLVCAAQRTSNPAQVVLNGSGFTPMPTSVLALPAVLQLPTVELAGVADLAGADVTSPQIATFAGDPAGELASRLTWQSRSQMTIAIAEPGGDVTDSLELTPGLYDVTITNPDGKQTATLERGLAVVPPPSITRVQPTPPVLCTDQSDREITIVGQNFLRLGATTLPSVEVALGTTTEAFVPDSASGCVDIPGTYAGTTASLCTTLVVTLPEGLLDPGAYQVTVVSPPPASCQSSETATLVIVPPPFIDQLVPPAICIAQGEQTVTAEGGNFLRIADELPIVRIVGDDDELMLTPTLSDCAMLEGTTTSPVVELCTTLSITVTVDALPAGDYAITVENPAPAGCISTESISLTITSPPVVDSVAPSTVCEGGSRLSITGSGFRDGSTVTLRCPGDRMIAARAVTVISATSIDADIGSGILVDEVCEVIVTNPEGCEDRPEPHKTVRGTAGPFVFFADPFVVYNGVDTRVTLFSTTIETPLPSMPVTLVPSGQTGPTESFNASLVPMYPNRAQFTIPSGHAASVFDVILADNTGCSATLAEAITIVDQTNITLGSVAPGFGATVTRTAITVTRTGGAEFEATPRLFLNPSSGNGDAIVIESVTITDASTLTAVVPAGVPTGSYQLIAINPAGDVGVLDNAFRVLSDPPPVINDVTPQSMTNDNIPDVLTVYGSHFRGSTVSLSCRAPNGATQVPSVTSGAVSCDGTGAVCSQTATVSANTISTGAVCIVRVTNDPGTDGSFGEFSAVGVTNASLNLSNPTAGRTMATARRALVAAAVKVTRAARFVYAIGGDGGSSSAATPFDNVESTFVDVFGAMQPFADNAESLTQARSFAAGTAIGRYLYVLGGSDGTNALDTAERAIVLIPEETPVVRDVDLILGTAGLGAGQWSYRVSAVFANNDPDNPGGESLPSDTFIVRLPEVSNRRISVALAWSRPVDLLGVPLPNIASYRVYRTAAADETAGRDEVLIAEVDAADTEFTDDGTSTPMTGMGPLPLGSTGTWHALPNLGVPRLGAAAAVANDPADTDTSDGQDQLLYALMGRNGGTAHSSYEYLAITTLPNGRQTIGTQWTTGTSDFGTGRWEIGAWTADPIVAPVLDPDTYVYVGGGRLGNGTLNGTVQAGRVTDGGELVISAVNGFSANRSGYGVAAANGQLFAFGGQMGAPSSGAAAAVITGAPTLAMNAWNNEGLTLQQARYLTGSAVQSAFIFLVGGASGTGATATTELVIW